MLRDERGGSCSWGCEERVATFQRKAEVSERREEGMKEDVELRGEEQKTRRTSRFDPG